MCGKLRIVSRRHVIVVVGAGIPVARYNQIDLHIADGVADAIRYVRNQTRSVVTIVCVRRIASPVRVSVYKYCIEKLPIHIWIVNVW